MLQSALMAHREAIEDHLFGAAMTLFELQPTVTLYDLTNTYFEGDAGSQEKAQRGHSKEKRSDCPLLTLGLMLDASGFVRRSQVFAGNVSEPHTLAEMLTALQAPKGALMVKGGSIGLHQLQSELFSIDVYVVLVLTDASSLLVLGHGIHLKPFLWFEDVELGDHAVFRFALR